MINRLVNPFFYLVPLATILVILIWSGRVKEHRLRELSAQWPDIEALREGFLFWGVIFITLASALDWIPFVVIYLSWTNHSGLDFESAETIVKGVSLLCGIALILSITGRGNERFRTVSTSALLLLASLVMMLICVSRHGMSF